MRVGRDSDVHLTYCTNVHPGETWPELRASLERYVAAVKSRVAPDRHFGVGLRVSARAATELLASHALDELRALLAAHDLYVFTINGFPYGDFHSTAVKERVYRPDWLESERLDYSEALASLLAAILPADVEGSVSTVPVAHAPRIAGAECDERAANALIEHAVFLARLHERTGRSIALALEPEPECRLETSTDAVDFFVNALFSQRAVDRFTRISGFSRSAAETALHHHLGVCFDTCHAAVEFEDPEIALSRIAAAGIRIPKIQLSAGLLVDPSSEQVIATLRRFADDVYLHQVVESSPQGFRRFPDLLPALGAARIDGAEWRVHFHVPLFLERLGDIRTTRSFVATVLENTRGAPASPHLEVETYTWDVLPEEFRSDDVVTAITREMHWVLDRLTR
jgi:sugar phosphate isomerase/epimerase